MPRPKVQPQECRECGRTPTVARGLCERCYKRGLKEGFKAPAIPPVASLYAYPDVHPQAPGGQRIVVFKCPHCKREHLVSWLPFDEHPGIKIAICRKVSSKVGGGLHSFFVLAPSVILNEPPEELRPKKRDVVEPAVSESRFMASDGEFEMSEATVA